MCEDIYPIRQPDGSISMETPQEGRWYSGVTASGASGALAKWERGCFRNSIVEDEPGFDMHQYSCLLPAPLRA